MVAREHQQIPATAPQLQHVGLHRLLAHLTAEALVAHVQAAVQSDGLDYHRQELLALGHALQNDAVLHRRTVGQCHVHRHRRQQPTLNRMVGQLARVREIILVLLVALHHQAKQLEDFVTIAVERRAIERVAHLVGRPFLLQRLQREALVLPDGRYQPQALSYCVALIHSI